MNVENIEKVYQTKNKQIKALTNFTYEFKKGTFYAITGNSGSGKSTLIRVLGLIDKMNSGKYLLNGADITKLNDIELSKLRMKMIGFVFQDFYLDNYLKAYENVMLPMLINKDIPKEKRKEKAIALLQKLGLDERINHYPKELSGGEQQRVAIARALVNNPKIVLADEPTGNLDEKNEDNILDLIKKIDKKNKCIIIVTHSPKVKKIANTVLKIYQGKLVETNE